MQPEPAEQPRPPSSDPQEIARLCARIAEERKARDILVLDVEKMLVITSCFVIATGETRRQLQAIADAIHEQLKRRGLRRLGLEGYEEGQWVLLDYGDVIVQLLDPEARERYRLEMIWGDAPRVAWQSAAGQEDGDDRADREAAGGSGAADAAV